MAFWNNSETEHNAGCKCLLLFHGNLLIYKCFLTKNTITLNQTHSNFGLTLLLHLPRFKAVRKVKTHFIIV